MWQLSLAIFLALIVAQTLIKRRLAVSSDTPESIPSLVSYLIGVLPLGMIVGLMIPHHVIWSWGLVGLLLLQGGTIALFGTLSLKAFKILPASHFQTLFQVNSIIVILLGWSVLGEKLTMMQLIGGSLLLVAAYLAIWAPARAHRSGAKPIANFRMGAVLTIVSAISLGIGLIAEKAALQHMDLGAYFIYGFAAQTLFLGLLAIPDLRSTALRSVPKTVIKQSAIFGLVSSGVGFSYLYTLAQADNISLVIALRSLVLPLTAVAAHYLLKERDDNRLLWLAMFFAVAGVSITAL